MATEYRDAQTLDWSSDNGTVRGTKVISWAGLDGDDKGEWAEVGDYSDRTVQGVGTFDSASLAWEGSNDPRCITDPTNASAFPLVNASGGAAIALTAATQGNQVLQNPRFVRPSNSGGGGSTSLTAYMFCKKG